MKQSGAAISSKLIPPKVFEILLIQFIISLESFESISISIESISANLLNKTDLIDDKEMKKIEKNLKKITKSEIITISTIKKKYISKIKAKLVGYAS